MNLPIQDEDAAYQAQVDKQLAAQTPEQFAEAVRQSQLMMDIRRIEANHRKWARVINRNAR